MGSNDSLYAAGSVTTPAAGAAICTITAPPAGSYAIDVIFGYSGTAETQANNVRLKKGATNVGTLYAKASGTETIYVVDSCQITVDGTQDISVNAIALATTGSVYNAAITITRL